MVDAIMKPAAECPRYVFQGREAALLAACKALGVALPDMLRVGVPAGRKAAAANVLRLGPAELLILAPDKDVLPLLEKALSGKPHSLVAVSDRQVGLDVAGPGVTAALSCLSPLDFDVAAFPVGTATRSLLGKADGVIWRLSETEFRLEVWRSFMPYVRELLHHAMETAG